ncbi:kinase-like domain-containing protein [Aspergillus caelatus]|uniref:Mitogen-activated protein kinase n=2 Tax=Aspergillus subgen. Circumdati TaxID=2720871 RepID=A0A5N7AGZ6_9EURO|nr:kinase-like domain-containing protein [Aspergillus caelatus]KAE8368558.1 kinase-like domain-containing protein [Aspergillus caelatus]KAE8423115.1 kinase-like domain-containing protein [Aspergillus pseudocaelatus]
MAEFNRSEVLGSVFDTTSRYINVRPVGLGAFSLVCSAYDLVRGQAVAIKKLLNPFATTANAKQTYREIKLLKQLRHENLIGLCDVFISPRTDVYLVTELLSTDLGRLLEAGPLEPQFVQYFAYQILRGLKYLHSAGVVHRDIKPSNLVIDENCDLKICDFGLSRPQDHRMTGYVSTRYYRAPEVMLTWQRYGVKMDIWSAGCVIAEMFNGRPLFPGQDPINQFYLILDVLGNPSDKFISRICTTNTVEIIRSLERREPRPLQSVIQNLDDSARSMLEGMLTLDPQERISAEEALQHPYMRMYHDPTDEPIAEEMFDWVFNGGEFDKEILKEVIFMEVLHFHQSACLAMSPMGLKDPTIPQFSETESFLNPDAFTNWAPCL